MQIVAAIDAGSNALRMSVGRLGADGQLEIIENVRVALRLGSEAFTSGQISEPTLRDATDAFLRFRRIADDFFVTDLRAVATSALRDARNSDDLVERVARLTDITLEVIAAEEEARLIHLAVAHEIDLRGKRAILVDIGGGSVEVTISDGENIICTESYDLGTVRLLERFGASQVGRPSFSHLVRESTEAVRRRIEHEIGAKAVDLCIGTGGNLKELGELRSRLFTHDSAKLVTVRELGEILGILAGLTVEERIGQLQLRPDRADVILPACVVMHSIATMISVQEVRVPGVGLKDGILRDVASRLSPAPPRRGRVLSSALRLAGKYEMDAAHGAQVADLACQLFDQSMDLHGLGHDDRLLLEVAALLHDVGRFVSAVDHDQHGHYLLRNSFVSGLTKPQQAVVANLVRYHRRTKPSLNHAHFRALPADDRLKVEKLAVLLRLADGVDTGQAGRVSRVTLEASGNIWRLELHGEGDLALERWSLAKRRALFQTIFGTELQIT